MKVANSNELKKIYMNCRVRSPNAPFKGLIGDQALRNFSEVPRSSRRPRGPLARRELRGIKFSKKLSSPLMGED